MSAGRVRAIDWHRGLAVLVMVQTHTVFMLRPALREGPLFRLLERLDGWVAPSFLFCAGFSLALVQVRAAQAPGRGARVRKSLRRIAEVLLAASLVNWMWFPIFQQPVKLLRIDILQCVGLSLLLALLPVAALAGRPRALIPLCLALGTAVFAVAPLGEAIEGPWALLLNQRLDSPFPLLPWAGFVLVGAAFGALAASRPLRALAWALVLQWALGEVLWQLQAPLAAAYPPHHFGWTNPADMGRRLTSVAFTLLALLWVETRRPGWVRGWPKQVLETFGTASLSAYVFHQGMLFWHPFKRFDFSFRALFEARLDWAEYWPVTALVLALTWLLIQAFSALRGRTRAALEARGAKEA